MDFWPANFGSGFFWCSGKDIYPKMTHISFPLLLSFALLCLNRDELGKHLSCVDCRNIKKPVPVAMLPLSWTCQTPFPWPLCSPGWARLVCYRMHCWHQQLLFLLNSPSQMWTIRQHLGFRFKKLLSFFSCWRQKLKILIALLIASASSSEWDVLWFP